MADHVDADKHQALPLCDIVMEGGVTSGIVYPKAVVELSKVFRLKSIGGTSVGALAAAISAAAELGRLRDPGAAGFHRMEKLPGYLSGPGFSGARATRLFDLFQPQSATRPLFNVLTASLNRSGKLARVGFMLLAAIRNYAHVFAAVAGGVLVLQRFAGVEGWWNWLVAVTNSIVFGLGAVAYAMWRTLTGPLVRNGYGMCTGYLDEGAPAPEQVSDDRAPLVLWLSREINRCAGLAPDGPPLTFGQLWTPGDPASRPPPWLREAGIDTWHYIDLEMMSTNLTHGRPYRFPYVDDDQELFFDAKELETWFPPNVIKQLVDCAHPYAPHQDERKPALREGLYKLPRAEDLPVVFAARLSLSFPLLLSAVPLYAIDYENQDYDKRQFEPCWFSDGGICSNFPIHFFDTPIPLWPTFGVQLAAERKYHPIRDTPDKLSDARFFLPPQNSNGRGDQFLRFDEAEPGRQQLFGFLGAILNSARHWQNHMAARAPGVRDRVVRVYLKSDEGGLNLNMPKDVLTTLSSSGEHAAAMLATKFRPDSTSPMNFDNHRWMRLRNLTRVLEADMSSVHKALDVRNGPGLTSIDALIDTLGSRADPDDHGANAEQRTKMKELLKQLKELSQAADDKPDLLKANAPRRKPVLRIVPDV